MALSDSSDEESGGTLASQQQYQKQMDMLYRPFGVAREAISSASSAPRARRASQGSYTTVQVAAASAVPGHAVHLASLTTSPTLAHTPSSELRMHTVEQSEASAQNSNSNAAEVSVSVSLSTAVRDAVASTSAAECFDATASNALQPSPDTLNGKTEIAFGSRLQDTRMSPLKSHAYAHMQHANPGKWVASMGMGGV